MSSLWSQRENALASLDATEIDRLESDADRVMRSAMSRLFREEKDVREVMKMHAIYQLLESITDRCLDVANLAEGISLVPQGRCNFPLMTVRENLELGAFTLRGSAVAAAVGVAFVSLLAHLNRMLYGEAPAGVRRVSRP